MKGSAMVSTVVAMNVDGRGVWNAWSFGVECGLITAGGWFGLEIDFAVGAACFDIQPVCHTWSERLWAGFV